MQWTNAGIEGASRLIQRVWSEFEAEPDGDDRFDIEALRRAMHRRIKDVTEAIEDFRFNSAIARLYEFVAILRSVRPPEDDFVRQDVRREALSVLARLIAPFAPHLAEECWMRLGEEGMVAQAPWPTYDPNLVRDDERILPVQIDGKRRGEVRAPLGASEAEVRRLVLDDPDISRRLEGLTLRKMIVVQDRIVNLVTG